jgi:hypothetical protein
MKEYVLRLKHTTLKVPMPEGWDTESKVGVDGGHPSRWLHWPCTLDYLNDMHDLVAPVPKGVRVLDICGGLGIVGASMWDHLEPRRWTVIDIDPVMTANNILRDRPGVKILTMSMYDYKEPITEDLVILDFNSLTLGKLLRGEKEWQPMRTFHSRISRQRPKFWEVTDVGPYWVHLKNHHRPYLEYFGVAPTRENYPDLMAQYYRKEHGYQLINHRVSSGAGFFLFQTEETL